jgi:anaerobic selenocysteine-containing dehydrogenase
MKPLGEERCPRRIRYGELVGDHVGPDGRAQFSVSPGLAKDPSLSAPNILTLGSMRSHDQYNTTVYGLDDRYRGVFGRRDILFMNVEDMSARGLASGDTADVMAVNTDGSTGDIVRCVEGLTAIP